MALVAPEFDPHTYRREYPDLAALDDDACLRHFCSIGWREGRNPNTSFDTTAYLLINPDVLAAGVNPFLHFIHDGRREGRSFTAAVSPTTSSLLLFGYPVTDWVERMGDAVDADFYRTHPIPCIHPDMNLAAHFAFVGWRFGLSPNPTIDMADLTHRFAAVSAFLVNPLLIQNEIEAGRYNFPVAVTFAKPQPPAAPVPAPQPSATQDPPDLRDIVGAAFDAHHYLALYADVAEAGVDPLQHFVVQGWREGRRPNRHFNTAYYLSVYNDVARSGLNPFYHYLVRGRQEGRRATRPGGRWREIIDAAKDPRQPDLPDTDAASPPTLEGLDLASIRTAFAQAQGGGVVSISHDCYVRSVGGTQIFISDEQIRYNAAGRPYLHLSPATVRRSLAPAGDDITVQVVLDGTLRGALDLKQLLDAIFDGSDSVAQPMLIVHCLFGFNLQAIAQLHAKLRPAQPIFWLHDYSSICSGFNLLRNNVAFCHAPPVHSLTCRVCIHGTVRPGHTRAIQQIFELCDFTVLAPSDIALQIWRGATTLPYRHATVHPHWTLRPATTDFVLEPRDVIDIVFVGYPVESKGWHLFNDIVDHFEGDGRFAFQHYAHRQVSANKEIGFVCTAVSGADRFATIDLLRRNRPHFIVLLSTWPETFSFVAHEAIVAGCPVLCLADSGNIAAVIRRTDGGKVFETVAEIVAFLDGPEARPFLADWAARRHGFDVAITGTTASFEAYDHA